MVGAGLRDGSGGEIAASEKVDGEISKRCKCVLRSKGGPGIVKSADRGSMWPGGGSWVLAWCGAVVASGGEGGGVEPQRTGGSSVATDECRGWSIGVCGSSSTCGVVFGYNFGDGGVEVDKEVVFEVAGNSRELCVVVLGVVNDLVKK